MTDYRYDCYPVEGARSVTMLLMPEEPGANRMKELAREYATTIVAIYGFDEKGYMTPWPASVDGAGVFGGGAPDFRDLLGGEILESAMTAPGMGGAAKLPLRLVGTGLSGLYAVWQWAFAGAPLQIAAISGAFWFPDFAGWLKEARTPMTAKDSQIYLSMTDVEARGDAGAGVQATIGEATQQVERELAAKGASVTLNIEPGGPYTEFYDRLRKALDAFATFTPR